MSMNLQKELQVAVEAAKEAAKVIRDSSRLALSLQTKSDGSFVTKADVNTQKLIVDILKTSFPTDSFLCEESENHVLTPTRTWIIDPLDGTANYVKAIPFVAVNISLWIDFAPMVSVTYDVFHDEYLCKIGNQPVETHIKNYPARNQDLIIIDNIQSTHNRASIKEKACLAYDSMFAIRSLGSAALGMMYVVLGRASAYFAPNVHIWDIASGLHFLSGDNSLEVCDLFGAFITFENIVAQQSSKGLAVVRRTLRDCFWKSDE